jgi:hypothetical protein
MGRIWNGTDKDRHDSKTPPTKDPSSYFGVQKNNGRPTKLHTTKKQDQSISSRVELSGDILNPRKAKLIGAYTHRLEIRGKEASWVGESWGEWVRRSGKASSHPCTRVPAGGHGTRGAAALWHLWCSPALQLGVELQGGRKVDLPAALDLRSICRNLPCSFLFQFSCSCQVLRKKHLVGARMLRCFDLVVTGEYSSRFLVCADIFFWNFVCVLFLFLGRSRAKLRQRASVLGRPS